VGLLAVALGVVNLLAALYSLASTRRYLRYAKRASEREPAGKSGPEPPVTLIVPCCGDEPGLERNLDALLSQRYPRYEARCVVESEGDGAVPAIERALARSSVPAERIVAGTARRQGQKVHNLLAAIDARAAAEVLVFADSDGRPEPDWLAHLVLGLEDPRAGASSSYRFYVPEPAGPATLLRSAWNLSVLALLGEHERNFAWGGAMALRREDFERLGVREAFRGALSDDYALTRAVRRAGRSIAFVPEALVASAGPVGLRELVHWTARQIQITRVYHPALFRLAAASHLLYTGFLVLAPLEGGPLSLGLLAAVVGLSCASGGLRAAALCRLAPRWEAPVRRYLWAYALLVPAVSALTVSGVLTALVSRRVAWRGKTYEMRSPTETIIVEG